MQIERAQTTPPIVPDPKDLSGAVFPLRRNHAATFGSGGPG